MGRFGGNWQRQLEAHTKGCPKLKKWDRSQLSTTIGQTAASASLEPVEVLAGL
ncbi:Hypothetical protein PMT_2669 [Prochlorococcus marinus str. MIT 9313]|uniref:Uncharacterized protein n=1 Tax=Prochlorococcus marinus (strain MIT 9313) TaxID=74547 RepID=B9ES53_PROMM|nr:Hypothetical protein PMT_2669 [Prochlorococcus marinus str. MIT 9313]